jgi:hypothetical protein
MAVTLPCSAGRALRPLTRQQQPARAGRSRRSRSGRRVVAAPPPSRDFSTPGRGLREVEVTDRACRGPKPLEGTGRGMQTSAGGMGSAGWGERRSGTMSCGDRLRLTFGTGFFSALRRVARGRGGRPRQGVRHISTAGRACRPGCMPNGFGTAVPRIARERHGQPCRTPTLGLAIATALLGSASNAGADWGR